MEVASMHACLYLTRCKHGKVVRSDGSKQRALCMCLLDCDSDLEVIATFMAKAKAFNVVQ